MTAPGAAPALPVTSTSVLEGQSLAPVSHITRMYAEVDETFLVTVRELDHYPERPASTYWGAWTRASGKAARAA